MKRKRTEDIKLFYFDMADEIKRRICDFERLWKNGSERDVFAELIFCILTPQSKAKLCFNAVNKLSSENLLLEAKATEICEKLIQVRVKYKKTQYIIGAQKQFAVDGRLSIKSMIQQFNESKAARSWVVKNVQGLGYKEASHFLRNIGFGLNLAILDRHILRNLYRFEVIKEIPKSLTAKKYLDTEEKMLKFANRIKIPMSHLDLLFWCRETGEVFK